MSEPKVTRKTLADYAEDERNANIGTPRGLGVIEDSLNYSGVGRSLVADKNGVLIAGNKTSLAAASAGIEDVIEIETDGDALIVHKRRDLDLAHDARAKALAIADNRASEVSLQWDDVQLAELLTEIKNEDETLLKAAGFYEDELDALLSTLAPAEPLADAEPQIDKADELHQKWQTERGQLWIIPSKTGKGEHRLLCGDSTNAEDVARVMGGEKADMVFADPPYGMNLDTDFDSMFQNDTSHRKTGERFTAVLGDDVDYDPRPVMAMFENIAEQFWWGADYYLDKIPEVSSGVFMIWDKRCSDEMDKVVGNVYEMAWSKQKHKKMIARILWSGHHGMQSDDTKTRVHPTQKPTVLVSWFFGKWGKRGDIVVDPYCGSGTTLVACEQTARLGRGIEIDPRYVAVTLQRLADMGLQPRLST